MNNNVILGIQGLKKMLKGLFFLAVLLMVVCADAKPRGQRQEEKPGQVPRQVVQTGGGPVVQQKVANRKVQLVDLLLQQARIGRNNLSLEGALIVRDVEAGYDWEPLWDKYMERIQNVSEKSFLKELRSSLVKKKKKVEEVSSRDKELLEQKALNRRLLKTLEGLQNQLAMQNKGFFRTMYESIAAASPMLGFSGGSAAVTTLLGITSTVSGGALVGISVLGLASGLSYVAEKLSTGEFTDAVGKLFGENVITQYINDSGRYPTFNARIEGIGEDILNTSNLDTNTFENYRKTVLAQTIKAKENAFENAAIKELEEKIDRQIKLIQDKYFNEDAQIYMRNLEGIKNIENIIQAQAIISEYLRAAFREEQAKLLESKKTEGQEAAQQKPQQSSWWSLLGY